MGLRVLRGWVLCLPKGKNSIFKRYARKTDFLIKKNEVGSLLYTKCTKTLPQMHQSSNCKIEL